MDNNDILDLEHRIEACKKTSLLEPKEFPLLLEDYTTPNGVITVVRDDILCGGTKSRFLYPFLEQSGLADQYREFVYISPWHGGAQIALAWTCMLLTRKRGTLYRAIIFTEAPEGLADVVIDGSKDNFNNPIIPAYTRMALLYGAEVHFISRHDVYLEAENYLAGRKAFLLESGFNYPEIVSAIADLAAYIRQQLDQFHECWSAVGSGTLLKGLQEGEVAESYHGICIFQACPNNPNAELIIPEVGANQTFAYSTFPPFPSALYYDAKVWPYLQSRQGRILFWNVM